MAWYQKDDGVVFYTKGVGVSQVLKMWTLFVWI
jgi:hypothetical protein